MASQTALTALVLLLTSVAPATTRAVDVPLRFDNEFIRQALVEQLYTGPDQTAVVWDDGTGCGFLKLRDPSVNGVAERLRVVTRGEARVGTSIGGFCLAPLQWEGFIEVFEEPAIAADQRAMRFRVIDSNIYDAQWKKGLVTGRLWDLVKGYVQPRLEAVRIDLGPAVDDLRGLLPLLIARDDTSRLQAILDSIHLSGA